MKKTITLSIDDWNRMLGWLNTHKDRENTYQDWQGNIDDGSYVEWKEWQDEYDLTEKAINNLRKKINK